MALSVKRVESLRRVGRHGDGGGLVVKVNPSGSKSYQFRYKRNGRDRRMGLGPVDLVSLADARDWAAERTSFANEILEMALAHVIENKAEAAYRRGDLLDKRRQLMKAWADYCASPVSTAEVTPIRAGR
jgi:hypothetical protein